MPSTVESLSNLDAQRESPWDVVVIGAGPAGSLTAQLAASQGLCTLLVESKEFPRNKVCGGCLNARALNVLEAAGVLDDLKRAGAVKVERLRLACGRQAAQWSLPSMLSISRLAMDAMLVKQAIAAGAAFLPQTTAHVEPIIDGSHRIIRLNQENRSAYSIRAKVVVAASGLSSSSLTALPEFKSTIATGTRIGVGTVLAEGWEKGTESGTLTMAVGRSGYVGLACVESNRLNVAAAVDADALKSARVIPQLISEILSECNIPIPHGIDEADWIGTPALTRRRANVAAERLLVVGDAAGYVEPFTGEGMSWALQTAVLSAPLIVEGCRAWNASIEQRWQRLFLDEIRQRQWMCRGLSSLLRRPTLASVVLRIARSTPWIARHMISQIAGPSNRRPLERTA